MSFEAFKLMCELMIKESTMECVFAVSWLTTQWNLISQSEATETISFSQIYWGGDHVKIFFRNISRISLESKKMSHGICIATL